MYLAKCRIVYSHKDGGSLLGSTEIYLRINMDETFYPYDRAVYGFEGVVKNLIGKPMSLFKENNVNGIIK